MKSRFLRVRVDMLIELKAATNSLADLQVNLKHDEIREALYHTIACDGVATTGNSSLRTCRFGFVVNSVGERVVPGALVRRCIGFSKYQVFKPGYVTSARRYITPRTNHGGYREVKLVDDAGRRRWVKVHNLVLEAFAGPRPSPKYHGAHLDGDKANNRVDNLAWKLPVENEADKKAHGTAPKGTVAHAKRLSKRERFQAWKDVVMHEKSLSATAKKFGVHRSTVAKIVKRKEQEDALARRMQLEVTTRQGWR